MSNESGKVKRYYWSDETGKVYPGKPSQHGWHREMVLASDFDALTQQLAQLQAQNTALLAREKLLEGVLRKARTWIGNASDLATLDPYVIYGEIDAALRPSGGEGEK